MKIQNLMKAPIFFPYAGIQENRGRELKSEELSDDLDAGRFFNKLLQADWKAGKIAVFINAADQATLGASVVDAVRLAGERKGVRIETPKAPVVEKMPLAIAEVPISSLPQQTLPPVSTENAPTKAAAEPVKIVETPAPAPQPPAKQPAIDVPKSIGSVSLAELNAREKKAKPSASEVLARAAMAANDTSVAGFKNEIPPQAAGPGVPETTHKKSSLEDIKKHMGGLV